MPSRCLFSACQFAKRQSADFQNWTRSSLLSANRLTFKTGRGPVCRPLTSVRSVFKSRVWAWLCARMWVCQTMDLHIIWKSLCETHSSLSGIPASRPNSAARTHWLRHRSDTALSPGICPLTLSAPSERFRHYCGSNVAPKQSGDQQA